MDIMNIYNSITDIDLQFNNDHSFDEIRLTSIWSGCSRLRKFIQLFFILKMIPGNGDIINKKKYCGVRVGNTNSLLLTT